MNIRQNIEALIPEIPREIVKGFLRKAFYPDYGFNFDNRKLRAYHVKNALPAHWSADSQKPYGTLMIGYGFAHFLLARAVIRICDIHSWCDLGTGSATLPFHAGRLGITEIFAIEGSEAALRAGKVRLPLSNYCVADICLPLEVITESGAPACFDVVSALELVEHIPDSKLTGLFDNIKRLQPKFVIFAVGLQPEPPYHINLKSMLEWLDEISSMLSGWVYDDTLSTKIFRDTRCHSRYVNEYNTNHLPLGRNLIIFVKQ
jgi:2-polyprenyl-3-methyl-5-hydroxy-6-metoxy-1,4-benzoquinol methylase